MGVGVGVGLMVMVVGVCVCAWGVVVVGGEVRWGGEMGVR